MEYVTKEEVKKQLDSLSREDLDGVQQIFMVKSANELADSLARFINLQTREAIICALLWSAADVMANSLLQQLHRVEERAKNARNN